LTDDEHQNADRDRVQARRVPRGGGYSGGGGQTKPDAGGGGSFVDGQATSQALTSGAHAGSGLVTIQFVQ
jgi:hypothetical protein